jgi:hypothetical protein
MRSVMLAAALLMGPVGAAEAQVSIGVGLDIGVHVSSYPELVIVPGYPVYYDPQASTNYFFYDGAYWVFQNDGWYVSSWYDGPWSSVGPHNVPLYVLRVPVRYYRQPPTFFQGWRADAPPRWGEHYGRGWEQRRKNWNRWDRHAVPRAAPLPVYQRQYSGDRYPRAAQQQHVLRTEHDRYRPRDAMTRQHLQPIPARHAPQPARAPHAQRSGPAPQGRANAPSPQEQGRGPKAAPHGQDRDDNHDERGRGHR